MDDRPKITVLSLIYNTAEPLVRKAVESILNQTFRDFEYIIQDNGCTDRTKDILAEYAEKDERIRLIRHELNSVIHLSEEAGVQRDMDVINTAKGGYICRCDSDDWYETDFLEDAYRQALENGAGIVIGGLKFWSEAGDNVAKFDCPFGVYKTDEETADIWVTGYRFFRGVWGKIVRTELWQKYYSLMGAAGNFSDCYVNQCWVGERPVIVATGKIAYNWLSRNDSDSSRLAPSARVIDRSTILYRHNLEILSKLNAVTQERLDFFKTIFRAGILYDDFRPLERAKDLQPAEVMRMLEKLVTDDTVCNVFPNLDSDNEALTKVLNLAVHIQSAHSKKKSATVGFLANIARVWSSTEQMKKSNAQDIRTFVAAVYSKSNAHNFGKGLLPDLFKNYQAPFAELLAVMPGSALNSAAFMGKVVKRGGVGVLTDILTCAYDNSDNAPELLEGAATVLSANADNADMGEEFWRRFPYETSLIYHGGFDKAFDELEHRFGAADTIADMDAITEGQLRMALIANDGGLFVALRKRRVEMFENAGMAEEASRERALLAEIIVESEVSV